MGMGVTEGDIGKVGGMFGGGSGWGWGWNRGKRIYIQSDSCDIPESMRATSRYVTSVMM